MYQQLIKRQTGFTLLEVSVTLVVLGILAAGGLMVTSHVSDINRYKLTQETMKEVNEAVQGFYVHMGHLPCPDIDGDGREDIATTSPFTCSATNGYLPHVTLGAGALGDAWGQPFKYAVYPHAGAQLGDACRLDHTMDKSNPIGRIHIRSLDEGINATDIAKDVAYVVLSTGKNGALTNAGMTAAFSGDGGCQGLHTFENNNCSVSATNSQLNLHAGTPLMDKDSVTFDDMLIWLESDKLYSLAIDFGVCSASFGQERFDPSYLHRNEDGSELNFKVSGHKKLAGGVRKTSYMNVAENAVVVQKELNGNLTFSGTNKNKDKMILLEARLVNYDGDFTEQQIFNKQNFGITTGDGNDIIRIMGTSWSTYVDMGKGNDILEVLGGVSSLVRFTIDMGQGDDIVRLYEKHPSVANDIHKDTDQAIIRNAWIDMGTGQDVVYLEGDIANRKLNDKSNPTGLSNNAEGNVIKSMSAIKANEVSAAQVLAGAQKESKVDVFIEHAEKVHVSRFADGKAVATVCTRKEVDKNNQPKMNSPVRRIEPIKLLSDRTEPNGKKTVTKRNDIDPRYYTLDPVFTFYCRSERGATWWNDCTEYEKTEQGHTKFDNSNAHCAGEILEKTVTFKRNGK